MFTVPFSSFSVLLSFYDILANLLTHQRCWHIEIKLSKILNKLEFNEISGMLQFHLIFDSQIVIECPENIFKKLLSDKFYDNSSESFS